MVSYYLIHLSYICDVALMKNLYDSDFLGYHERELPEKIL